MRTTIITSIAILLVSVSAFAEQKNQTLTIKLPKSDSMETIVQDISGYLAMQGSSVRLQSNGNILEGKRVDGFRFEVLFKAESQHATVQCQANRKTVANRPSLKHKQTGWRFKKANPKAIDACTQYLALSVRRALR